MLMECQSVLIKKGANKSSPFTRELMTITYISYSSMPPKSLVLTKTD